MYIPKIGLTHIFFEALQNFKGERLSKIYDIRQNERKERHNLPPLRKTDIKIPSNGLPPDFLAMEFSKTPIFLSGTNYALYCGAGKFSLILDVIILVKLVNSRRVIL